MTPWLKHFPHSLQIGTDLCYIPRIAQLLKTRSYGFPEKFLNSVERADHDAELSVLRELNKADKLNDTEYHVPKKLKTRFDGLCQLLAGRWAAKEAIIKAAVDRKLYMQDITILRGVSQLTRGPPLAFIPALDGRKEQFEMVKISISHDVPWAIAMAMVNAQPAVDGIEDRIREAIDKAKAPSQAIENTPKKGEKKRSGKQPKNNVRPDANLP